MRRVFLICAALAIPAAAVAGGSPASSSAPGTVQLSAGGFATASFIGGQSRTVITSTVNVVLSATPRQLLSYQLSGATSDTACFIYSSSSTAPTFAPTNTGAAVDCGLAGSFVLQGQYRYSGPPPPQGYVLYGQVVGTAPSDTFALTAQW